MEIDDRPMIFPHALRAFSVHSEDYLLKPIEPEALERALGKVERLCATRSAILRMIQRYVAPPPPLRQPTPPR
jgi:DNA-binding LytR/AlgR family response regulator